MIDVQVKTSANVPLHLNILEKLLRRTDPLLKRSGVYMMSSIHKNFNAQGRPDKWEALKPMTIAMRKKKGYWPGKILQQTGNLKGSISYNLRPDYVEVGTSQPYARDMQLGKTTTMPAHVATIKAHKRKGGIKVREHKRNVPEHTFRTPARPFVMFQNEDIDAINKIGVKFLRDVTDKVVDK